MDKCGLQGSITITIKHFSIMKVVLNITAASRVISMSNCPKDSELRCGILYRVA